jgi:tRNA uracil 4-sulfurtransferase
MVYIIRYSEIGTKGKNRKDFEKKLVENIKRYFKINQLSYEKVERTFGRILVYFDEKQKINFTKIFGISSYSKAIETKADFEEIKKTIIVLLKNKKFNSFRVSANRIDKEFKMSSVDIEKVLGAFVVEKFNRKVSLKEFDLEMSVEFYGNSAFAFTEKINCFAGLPVGSEGTIYSLIENKNSLLASILIMKRGCSIMPVAFKKIKIDMLQKYMPVKRELKIINDFKELDSKISNFIISGQTLDSFKKYETAFLILSPLIAFDKQEIKSLEERYQ